ncbi:hypothetical protein C4B68_06260 [Streptomyces dengpaensis]|uniref:Uncharacterized protein n=1 Tax=Streptomyces dengpaensis TaxID=2049881 RepID=A0ABN5HXZ0_9ACTN|nr:hypothetical protein C4B68_06260 [Streptomyces dengpaensis]PIB11715.1 hypothetical protein B1C81_00230 [Streptomyces sp. HG99]
MGVPRSGGTSQALKALGEKPRVGRVGAQGAKNRPPAPVREQAFSVDGERTCVTNWVMEFTRPS